MINFFRNKPIISVIVVIYNMRREAKRTLFSLSSQCQQDVKESDYEVIVVENGSSEPLTEEFVKSFGSNFRYYYIKNAPSSPAHAINFGASKAKGRYLGIMIDGARMLTPGVIKYALQAFFLHENPLIATLNWHLGPDIQPRSTQKGYDQKEEDRLIETIKWPQNGYGLFNISTLAGICHKGWFEQTLESNCFFIKRATFEDLAGFDERFDLPGGGVVNCDFYIRACELENTRLFYILGEGSFHQVHEGTWTSADEATRKEYKEKGHSQYFKIRNKLLGIANKKISYIGHMPVEALKFLNISLTNTAKPQAL